MNEAPEKNVPRSIQPKESQVNRKDEKDLRPSLQAIDCYRYSNQNIKKKHQEALTDAIVCVIISSMKEKCVKLTPLKESPEN
jgi:hypothetical protein